jgi:hypothetical protein
MSKTLSVCVGGGVGGHKIHIFTANISTFIQDIDYRCLLLTSSTSFIDLPFQEHQMTEKHHMDQNSYISSLCSKPGVVTNNMTRGDDVAQSPGLVEPKWGRLAPPPWPVKLGVARA